MLKKTVFYILALLVSGLVFSGCQKQTAAVKENGVIPVRVAKIDLREFNRTVDYVGNIKAQDEAVVYPKVSGKIIEKVKEEGQKVNKGDVIAYIDRDEVGLKFEKAPVESPLSGEVGRIYVDQGTNVTIQTPIALVVDADMVHIDLDIPEKYLPAVVLGQEAEITVDAYPGEIFKGVVTRMSPVVDMGTRAAPIEITVDNPQHKLKSGMFSKVSLIVQKRNNIPVILKEAIMGKEPNIYVFIIENNKALLKKVSLGIRQGPYYEIREGLKEGDLVVIMGQQRLYDGASVAVEEDAINTETK